MATKKKAQAKSSPAKSSAKPKQPRRASPTVPPGLDASKLEPAAFWVPIEIAQRWERNPRRNKAAIKPVADAIRALADGGPIERGFGAPLLARVENGQLIAGDTRIQAAASLGMKRIPVRFMNLSVQKARDAALGDNKLGEIAEWDQVKLADIMREAIEAGDDLAGTGFSAAEIDRIIESALGETRPGRGSSDGGAQEYFEFRDVSVVISVPTADALESAMRRYADERNGSFNGFVEHMIACLNRGSS